MRVRAFLFMLAAIPAVATHAGAPVATPRIVAAAQPAIERMAHTATPLRDGRVLVAGGFTNVSQASRSAELYDPAARRFEALPRMVVPRHSHTATRLANGNVLIAGGYGADNAPVSDVEQFNVATMRFERVGAMTEPRAGHTAALLPDGNVLIAGGVGPSWHFIATAEVYDAAARRFVRTGSMSTPRESHTAVALEDGRVLVVGGHRDRRENIVLYASAELYDPVRKQFVPAGNMATRRHKHDAVRLADGRVLVSGGSDERDDRGAYRSTEIFDPVTSRFTPGPSLQLARYKHERSSVLLSDGRVLIAGGAPQPELMDIAERRSDVVPASPQLAGQFSAAAVMPGNRVLISGGYGNGAGPQRRAWEFIP